MANNKKENIFKRYFVPFGLSQVCDILMLLGAIMLIVGLFVAIADVAVSELLLLIGLCIYIAASALAILRAVLVLVNKQINHRAPEYKRAIVNTVIMGVIFALAVFALIWLLVA
jgi:hypothetical protein